ncbi:MAG: adenylate/guanylate cyclase domain-containing protein [Geminicoccaceae bacterium]
MTIARDDVETIEQWLIDRTNDATDFGPIFDGFCERVAGAGVPLMRAALGSFLLHPILEAQGYIWSRNQGLLREQYDRYDVSRDPDEWLTSPFFHMVDSKLERLALRLEKGEGTNRFPLLARLAQLGGTEYFAQMVEYPSGSSVGPVEGILCSWITDKPGGFDETDKEALARLLRSLAAIYKIVISVGASQVLMESYLGRDAGRRVIEGAIERGTPETIRTVIWFSDLRGFTRLSDTLPGEATLSLLNAYAERIADCIQKAGGQVVKFVGDGILATFSADELSDAHGAAMDAADNALAAIEELSAERRAQGEPATEAAIALHEGTVLYGNIGSRDRLDFTVIGQAVNEASRIGELCKSLEQTVVISDQFAAAAPDHQHRLIQLGRFALRGVSQPRMLYTLER